MHAHDEDFFIVRTVENPDSSSFRKAVHIAPEKVMFELSVAWVLKAEHLATLRVNAGHHMADNPILAGSVHRLKDQ